MIQGPSGRSEGGTTLIELVVAVAIMGVAFVAILGGIGSAIIGAAAQRRDATAGVVLTSAAEAIVAAPYLACAALYVPPAAPSGYTVTVTKVAYWQAGSNRFLPVEQSACGPATASPTDDGVQLVTLSVTPPARAGVGAGTTQTLDVVKRDPGP